MSECLNARTFRLVRCTFVAVLLLAIAPCRSTDAQDYPWYDQETNSVVPVLSEVSDVDSSAQRKSVAKIRPSRASNMRTGSGPQWNLWPMTWNFFNILMYSLITMVFLAIVFWLFVRFRQPQPLSGNVNVRLDKKPFKSSVQDLPFQLESGPKDCRVACAEAMRNGDFSKAIVYLFSHALLFADEHDLVRLRKGKTNRQYLRELVQHEVARNYLERLLLPFESVFFGGHEANREIVESLWSDLASFESSVSNRTREAVGT
ncbi:MAG: DUF4129 domain-containing protein [Pirellulaceae bacterium]